MRLYESIRKLLTGLLFLFASSVCAHATRTGGKAEHMENMTDLYGPLSSSGSASGSWFDALVKVVLALFLIIVIPFLINLFIAERKLRRVFYENLETYKMYGWKRALINLEVAEELKEEKPEKYTHLFTVKEFTDYARSKGIKIDTSYEPNHSDTK